VDPPAGGLSLLMTNLDQAQPVLLPADAGRVRLMVIGGGAAGFFCAVNAARLNPAIQVVLVEKTGKVLAKVKVSGGGRCNVTHSCFTVDDMIKNYPRGGQFLKRAFHHFFTFDTLHWFAARGVQLKTEADGRIFPVTDSSQTIIDCLQAEALAHGVEIFMHTGVKKIERNLLENGPTLAKRFRVFFSELHYMDADFVCVCTGGLSKPEMSDWLIQLGHSVEAPVASLFTFNLRDHPITQLTGVSVDDVQVKILGHKLSDRGSLLITHWGLSGPVILRLSAWGARQLVGYRFTVCVNWLPRETEQSLRSRIQELRMSSGAQKIVSKNPWALPARLWTLLTQTSGISAEVRWADLASSQLHHLIQNLIAQELPVSGKTSYKEEFVTAGGIKLQEIDPHTMQSKIVPGLFFGGEVMDVDGITGGFNFQHAWTSGFIAAKTIASLASPKQAFASEEKSSGVSSGDP
jgi:predicted Rossmann fold flavoprotein